MISDDMTWMINGVEQFFAVRAARSGLPLLVYLHGGPGDAALPLVLKYNRKLEEHFTVVVWEQRGAGKSYYEFSPQEAVCIDTFVQDARVLIERLLSRFGQEKVYLVGHSWGSVLGLRLAAQYPQLVHTYVGCGQVVNMVKSSRAAYDFAVENAAVRTAQRLAGIDCAYRGENWLDDLLFVTGQVVKHGGSLYGRSSYNKLIFEFLRSKEYRISDLIARQKGSLQAIRFLWPELMGVSFEDTTAYEMPVVFVEGRHDKHVSSELAKAYFDTIETEKEFFWFEQSCHFPQWSEADRFEGVMTGLLERQTGRT